MSHLDKILTDRAHLLYLITGKEDSGESAYYYVLVDKHKQDKFLHAFSAADMELTDFGKVVRSGFGDMPPEEIQAEMKQKYGKPN